MRPGTEQDRYRGGVAMQMMPLPMDARPEPVPVWMAALMASRCQATVNGEQRAVRWDHVCGRALYTNAGVHAEMIQPLGVHLEKGQTVAVSWIPGETAYTVEVYRCYDRCA